MKSGQGLKKFQMRRDDVYKEGRSEARQSQAEKTVRKAMKTEIGARGKRKLVVSNFRAKKRGDRTREKRGKKIHVRLLEGGG